MFSRSFRCWLAESSLMLLLLLLLSLMLLLLLSLTLLLVESVLVLLLRGCSELTRNSNADFSDEDAAGAVDDVHDLGGGGSSAAVGGS